jgi:NADH-quinone oxidoreductase subunit J
MNLAFAILASLTLVSAVAAMSLRNLVHCALCVALTFAGLAGLYLQLQAQFVGLTQVLVYVGAVAILLVFTILLTRGAEPRSEPIVSGSWVAGVAIAFLVFGVLAAAVLSSAKGLQGVAGKQVVAGDAAVVRIGEQLMTTYVLPLQVVGLLLTAALVGAVVLAMPEAPDRSKDGGGQAG